MKCFPYKISGFYYFTRNSFISATLLDIKIHDIDLLNCLYYKYAISSNTLWLGKKLCYSFPVYHHCFRDQISWIRVIVWSTWNLMPQVSICHMFLQNSNVWKKSRSITNERATYLLKNHASSTCCCFCTSVWPEMELEAPPSICSFCFSFVCFASSACLDSFCSNSLKRGSYHGSSHQK